MDDKSSDFYWQWAAYVDVAVALPVVWDGAPSQFDSAGGVVLGDLFNIELPLQGLSVRRQIELFTCTWMSQIDLLRHCGILKGYQPGWESCIGNSRCL